MKVVEGKITSPFGDRIHPLTGLKMFHNGIDIACPVETPVHSPVDGEIKLVYTHDTGGLTVILGDARCRFGFCHLSLAPLPAGTKVKKGDIIALSGKTGRVTGPHLHYTVQVEGSWDGDEWHPGRLVDPASHVEF
ncbi:MAG: M23 family metallopeptidase [Odoribacteraceae bacterium]|jgi:murein DD-endopeptidase MepM/ murein hydrolase activator NlpD|nr:M23 family metallopeptidase [Odoribacteraceae bacterium]